MAAAELVSEGGVGALTMAALADRCDCAVGTAYSYFSSKGALVAAVAVNAADTLRRSQLTARGAWEAHLEAAGVEEQEAALVRLLAYGAFVVAASHAHPNELAMLQAVLGDHQAGVGDAERTECLPALVSFLEEPTSLLRLGEGTGALARLRGRPFVRGCKRARGRIAFATSCDTTVEHPISCVRARSSPASSDRRSALPSSPPAARG